MFEGNVGIGSILIIGILVVAILYFLFRKPRRVRSVEQEDYPVPTATTHKEPPIVESSAQTFSESDEIDPVAEADVYMAYGRDIQAEEILKEALVKHPGNDQVRVKLLELYVNRKDEKSFRDVEEGLRASTGESGDVWDAAVRIGSIFHSCLDFEPGIQPTLTKTESPAIVDAQPNAPERYESAGMLFAILSDIKDLVDRGKVTNITAEVQRMPNGEKPNDKYVITIKLK